MGRHGADAGHIPEQGARLAGKIPAQARRGDPEGQVAHLSGLAVGRVPQVPVVILVDVHVVDTHGLAGQDGEQRPHGRDGHLGITAAADGDDELGGDGAGQRDRAAHVRNAARPEQEYQALTFAVVRPFRVSSDTSKGRHIEGIPFQRVKRALGGYLARSAPVLPECLPIVAAPPLAPRRRNWLG